MLLVMQVGGSGGTFPIEMTGPVFQAIYPFLPFTHGINRHARRHGRRLPYGVIGLSWVFWRAI